MKRIVLLLTLALLAFAGCENKQQDKPNPVDPNWKEGYAQGPRKDNDPELLIGVWVLKAFVNIEAKQVTTASSVNANKTPELRIQSNGFLGVERYCTNGSCISTWTNSLLVIRKCIFDERPCYCKGVARTLHQIGGSMRYSVSPSTLHLYYNNNGKFLLYERKQP